MANKQTRSYHASGLSRKVQKGQSDPDNTHSGYAITVEFPRSKGRHVNSSAERKASGKKPWQGAMRQPPKSLIAKLALEEGAAVIVAGAD